MADLISIRLGDLGRQLKETDKAFATQVRRQVRKAVGEAGADVLGAIRAEASTFSRRIPAATKITTSFAGKRAGVKVTTSSKRAPHARPLEFGNKNTYAEADVSALVAKVWVRNRRHAMKILKHNGQHGRGLRHPVFGNKNVIAEQAVHPFFFPSVVKKTPAMDRAFMAAIDQAVRDAGFH